MHAAGPSDLLQHRDHRGRERFVVEGHRIGRSQRDLHFGRSPHALGDVDGGPAEALVEQLAVVGMQRADSADQLDLFRDDVRAHAARNLPERDNRRVFGQPHLSAYDRLRGCYDVRSRHDRVHAVPRISAVGLLALYENAKVVRAGIRAATGVVEIVHLLLGVDMKGERGVNDRVGEHALLDHHLGAPLLALRRAFLGRLEDELDSPPQFRLHGREHLGDSHENGDVRVVAARMHHPDFLTVVGRRHP